ncbi:hypothetical protein BDY21DRAFT_111007 [Lineolata rhizophorae]|uniref:Uncharacterized protein n=1 Tax=Lineolata rhizophorae TaxID=578093 RepID=A0A6A6NR42_9PEZI|nr:hypothetical protein BDY21DRAFT_111007 [Lineolata rhizophorae]
MHRFHLVSCFPVFILFTGILYRVSGRGPWPKERRRKRLTFSFLSFFFFLLSGYSQTTVTGQASKKKCRFVKLKYSIHGWLGADQEDRAGLFIASGSVHIVRLSRQAGWQGTS